MSAASDLRQPLVLEGPVYSPDGAGGMSMGWAEIGRLWAAMEPQAGSERGRDGIGLSQARYRVIVRAAPEGASARPKPRQRFRAGERLLRITAVQPHDAQGRFLRCTTVEEVTA